MPWEMACELNDCEKILPVEGGVHAGEGGSECSKFHDAANPGMQTSSAGI